MLFISFPRKRRPKPPREERRAAFAQFGIPERIAARGTAMGQAQLKRLTGEFRQTKRGAKLADASERGSKTIEEINAELKAMGVDARQADAKTKARVRGIWEEEIEYLEELSRFVEKQKATFNASIQGYIGAEIQRRREWITEMCG
ncbi:MAG: hypothetical protein NTW59_03320 [Candidatus Diapherotrites archaeon]|nr:hypothetical protein [Candidatus Diapherotrites archaeon]